MHTQTQKHTHTHTISLYAILNAKSPHISKLISEKLSRDREFLTLQKQPLNIFLPLTRPLNIFLPLTQPLNFTPSNKWNPKQHFRLATNYIINWMAKWQKTSLSARRLQFRNHSIIKDSCLLITNFRLRFSFFRSVNLFFKPDTRFRSNINPLRKISTFLSRWST